MTNPIWRRFDLTTATVRSNSALNLLYRINKTYFWVTSRESGGPTGAPLALPALHLDIQRKDFLLTCICAMRLAVDRLVLGTARYA